MKKIILFASFCLFLTSCTEKNPPVVLTEIPTTSTINTITDTPADKTETPPAKTEEKLVPTKPTTDKKETPVKNTGEPLPNESNNNSDQKTDDITKELDNLIDAIVSGK